jgi:uncharacterized SAM-binding protein YcdF (DUF218 family)
MKTYDAIIVLATQPDPNTWEFPKQIYDCLNRAKDLLNKRIAPYVILSGNHAIKLDNLGLKQPFRECDKMADYLIENGISAEKILKEGDSRDTISNLYYMKNQILRPQHMKQLLFVVAEFRIPRLKLLCKRILGNEYNLEFIPIPCESGNTYNEPHSTKIQTAFLEPMKDGEDSWLDDKFYSAWMYEYWAMWDREHYPDIKST